jgi:2'-5' RNA ligase
MRLFCAIELPDDVRHKISEYSEQIRIRLPGISASWTRETNFHLTIKFVGDVAEKRVADLSDAASRAAGEVTPFTIRIAGNGVFPQRNSPRVIWIGIDDPTGSLKLLHARLDEESEIAGFGRESRPYHPHLTLARIRNNKNSIALKELLQSNPFETIEIEVSELCVIKSELSSKGSRYTVLTRHRFAK